MIIKWTDLEVGDIIKVTEKVKDKYRDYEWANKDLVINNISIIDELGGGQSILIYCNNSAFYFKIDSETGCHLNCDHLGQFFNIISLGDND